MANKNPKFKSSKKLHQAATEYFNSCMGEVLKNDEGEIVLNKNSQPIIVNQSPPTVSGLALALGFSSRKALLKYCSSKKCENVVKRAVSVIEEYAETRLFDKDGLNGAKFVLINNFEGWSDKPDCENKEENKLDTVLSAIGGAME